MNRLIRPHIQYLRYTQLNRYSKKHYLKPLIRRLNNTSSNLEYTESGEWFIKDNNCFKIGLAESSINELGELVYIEHTSEQGDFIKETEDLVVLESVKATAGLKAPFDCIATENNIIDELEQINNAPESISGSWLIKVEKC